MRNSSVLSCASALLLCAACSGEAPEDETGDSAVPELAESHDTQPAPAEGGAGQDEAEGTIPAELVGVWDYVEGTCARDSDMRLAITQSDFTFYESYGAVQEVTREGEEVLVTLAMEGEGETWTSTERLHLTDGGELHLTDPSGDSVLTDWPRKRCDG